MDFSTRRDQRPTRPCEGAFGHSSRLSPLETSILDEKVPSRDKRGRYARATSQENALREGTQLAGLQDQHANVEVVIPS